VIEQETASTRERLLDDCEKAYPLAVSCCRSSECDLPDPHGLHALHVETR